MLSISTESIMPARRGKEGNSSQLISHFTFVERVSKRFSVLPYRTKLRLKFKYTEDKRSHISRIHKGHEEILIAIYVSVSALTKKTRQTNLRMRAKPGPLTRVLRATCVSYLSTKLIFCNLRRVLLNAITDLLSFWIVWNFHTTHPGKIIPRCRPKIPSSDRLQCLSRWHALCLGSCHIYSLTQ